MLINVHNSHKSPRIALLPISLDAAPSTESNAFGKDEGCERVNVDELVVVRERLSE